MGDLVPSGVHPAARAAHPRQPVQNRVFGLAPVVAPRQPRTGKPSPRSAPHADETLSSTGPGHGALEPRAGDAPRYPSSPSAIPNPREHVGNRVSYGHNILHSCSWFPSACAPAHPHGTPGRTFCEGPGELRLAGSCGCLPARLDDARNLTGHGQLAEADAAQIEPAHVAPRPAATRTAVAYAHGVLATRLACDNGFLGHCFSSELLTASALVSGMGRDRAAPVSAPRPGQTASQTSLATLGLLRRSLLTSPPRPMPRTLSISSKSTSTKASC